MPLMASCLAWAFTVNINMTEPQEILFFGILLGSLTAGVVAMVMIAYDLFMKRNRLSRTALATCLILVTLSSIYIVGGIVVGLSEQHIPANHTSEGIHQPAGGSPKPSM